MLFWSWALSALLFLRNTRLPKLPIDRQPQQLGLGGEVVRFPASDGLQLEGWRIDAAADAPWLILCHGLGSNRADLLDIAAALRQRGFNLFLFDFRGHGGSAGRTTSFGVTEQRDVEGALAYLGAQPEIPAKPYGLYGISMGAAVGLLVAARDERIGAVVADSPYLDLEETLTRHLRLLYPWLPAIPFAWYLLSAYRMRFGIWPRKVSVQQAAGRLGSRPLLVIQGAADVRLAPKASQAIAASAGESAQVWVVPEAVHLEGFSKNPEEYVARISGLFRRGLQVL